MFTSLASFLKNLPVKGKPRPYPAKKERAKPDRVRAGLAPALVAPVGFAPAPAT